MIWIPIAAGALLLIAAYCVFENTAVKSTRYDISVEKEGGIRLVQLSDIHSRILRKKDLEKINAFRPDAVLITGDLFDRRKANVSGIAEQFGTIEAPVFYVPGNHEYGRADREEVISRVSDSGVRVLRCGTAEVNGTLITGLDYLGYAPFFSSEMGRHGNKKGIRLVLTHFPQFAEELLSSEADIMLCGHAHGGQFRIPFTRQGVFAPGQGLWPRYTGGKYDVNGKTLIVSRGLGNSVFPIRLFNRVEIVYLKVSGIRE